MPADLRPGDARHVGGYEILQRLGEGGQGLVYLGRSPTGELAAIKVLRAGWTHDAEARRRFAGELAAALKVPRACTAVILDADIDGDMPYIISEFVNGPSLDTAVKRDGPFSGAALERLAIFTSTALAAIHGARIVHRDFKPANVLIGPDGPRVVDFGIARALEATDVSRHTQIGTPPYMAPEQFGGGPLGPKADVWAWGATMVFAASGLPPFGTSGHFAALANRIAHGEPELGPLSGTLRTLVERCLAKQSARRPTVMELFQALVGYGEPLRRSGPPAAAPETVSAVPEHVLPFYFVCDESASMIGEPLDAVNAGLEALRLEMARAPAATRLCVIGFSGTAEVLLPMADLGVLDVLPQLRARGGTRYGPAMELLRATIERDVFLIKAGGGTVYRPTVFFLSDGRPNDESWTTPYRDLLSPAFSARPNVIAFGVGECNAETIRQVATHGAFLGDHTRPVGAALKEVATALTTSLLTSRGKLVIPEQVPGFASLPLDEV
ncbi:protein kinase domain-containing protein [Nonomuraea endophytica]|uniref:protein kinase domain-containing protein n=1 Tax=Nonomuraea endophytica TaxID=714136 RepID=UPI0037C75752